MGAGVAGRVTFFLGGAFFTTTFLGKGTLRATLKIIFLGAIFLGAGIGSNSNSRAAFLGITFFLRITFFLVTALLANSALNSIAARLFFLRHNNRTRRNKYYKTIKEGSS